MIPQPERTVLADIIAVDDSPEVRTVLFHLLERYGYRVHTAASGEEALELIGREGLPHLALVDVNMPGGMNGLRFCDELAQFTDVPTIMLTAVEDEHTVVQAIRQYVEDYVLKPFNPEELVARVRRVLERIGVFPFPMQSPIVIDKNLRLEFGQRRLRLGKKPVSLTPTECRLLYLLLRSPGKTVPTSFLLQRMWPLEVTDEDRLHVYIHRLRTKLKGASGGHRYIVSKRGVGYRFQADE